MQGSNSLPPASAYILENTVFHARHLPSSSKHSFTYPTLALLLRLSSLESHSLDLCSSRLFGYTDAGSLSPWARVTGIRPEAYLHDPSSYQHAERKGIREKLESVLERFGVGVDLDKRGLEDVDIWMLTMPRYLGVEGINPLTVFYCYKKDQSQNEELQLWVVVLEVHNTFGERHVYVLRTGAGHEDKEIIPGYTHSWTFPRQFHVSPFNDRSGYYTCSIVPPPHPLSHSSNASRNPEGRHSRTPPPLPRVFIQLRTPDNQLKLTASLRSTSITPLSTRNLLAALAKYPFTLMLSFPRIAWQAFRLHYTLGLDVYARPEPRPVDPALEGSFDGAAEAEVMKNARNDVQRVHGQLGPGGGLGWQPEGILERYSQTRVERFLKLRVCETGIRVRLVSTNPVYEPKAYSPVSRDNRNSSDGVEERELTIITRSPRAFLLLLASPSPAHALLLARDAERLLVVTDEKLFLAVFASRLSDAKQRERGTMVVQRILQWLRKLPIPRALLRGPEFAIPKANSLDVPPTASDRQGLSPLGDVVSGLPTLLVLSAFLILTYFEKAVFLSLSARFINGTEPWGMWERAATTALARKSAEKQ